MSDLIHQIKIGRSDIAEAVESVISKVDSGEIDPLEVFVHLKAYEKFVDDIKKRISKAVLDEAEKHGKNFTFFGCDILIKEMGVKYDYASCNDPVWNRLNEDKKEREAILKAMKKPMKVTDETTGETCQISPPVKTSTTTPQITFK